MSEAAAATPDPDPPRTMEELTAAQNVLLDRLTVLLEDNAALARRAGAAAVSPEIAMALDRGWHRVADVQGELRELRAEGRRKLARRSLAVAWEIMQPDLAPAPPAVPEPRRRRRSGSHRRHNPDQLPLPLRGLPSLVPAAAAAFRPVAAMVRHSGHTLRPAASALRNSTAHAWIAEHAAQVTAGTAATVIGGGVLLASVVPAGPPAHASGSWPGTGSPAGITASATPVASSPAQIRRAATRPDLDAQHAGPDDPAGALPGSYAPPPSGPSAQGSPSVSGRVAGTLRVSTSGIDLGAAYVGQVVITAVGGPVSWGAVRGSDSISLDITQGTLQAGESATIGIVATAAAQIPGGSATLRIWPGNIVVTVSWPALPVPVPSVLPTDLPTLSVP